ncbi:MAG: transferase [Firmicutes bacterium HGW-Firmicutes-14]|nr:MAG: transferase [Firmicutes bacterium HGW-Firmicutes-14]
MSTFKVYSNVNLGKNIVVGDFVIIGEPPAGTEPGELKTVIGDNSVIRSHTVIYAGNVIGHGFSTGHGAMVRENCLIGDNVSIGTHSVVEHHVQIEEGVRIHSQAFIPEYTHLKRGCWIGPKAALTNAIHPLCPKVKDCLRGPVIGEKAIIGANATILPHIRIGEGALVGAGSVVAKDVEPFTAVSGNPAKTLKKVSELTCKTGLTAHPYEME